eukprot:GHVT01047624.1.p1 GENE.GHVT01047624.1~~GHVT01047624.1.p1  ORF type:complete len:490 (+),score=55.26 GHVT01047624.1:454-1923(+)
MKIQEKDVVSCTWDGNPKFSLDKRVKSEQTHTAQIEINVDAYYPVFGSMTKLRECYNKQDCRDADTEYLEARTTERQQLYADTPAGVLWRCGRWHYNGQLPEVGEVSFEAPSGDDQLDSQEKMIWSKRNVEYFAQRVEQASQHPRPGMYTALKGNLPPNVSVIWLEACVGTQDQCQQAVKEGSRNPEHFVSIPLVILNYLEEPFDINNLEALQPILSPIVTYFLRQQSNNAWGQCVSNWRKIHDEITFRWRFVPVGVGSESRQTLHLVQFTPRIANHQVNGNTRWMYIPIEADTGQFKAGVYSVLVPPDPGEEFDDNAVSQAVTREYEIRKFVTFLRHIATSTVDRECPSAEVMKYATSAADEEQPLEGTATEDGEGAALPSMDTLKSEYEKFALELQSFSQFSTSTIQKTVQIGTECLGILGTVFEGQTIVAALSSKDSAEIAVIPSGQVVESSHGGNEVQVSEEGWTAFVQKHNQVLQEFHPAMVEE